MKIISDADIEIRIYYKWYKLKPFHFHLECIFVDKLSEKIKAVINDAKQSNDCQRNVYIEHWTKLKLKWFKFDLHFERKSKEIAEKESIEGRANDSQEKEGKNGKEMQTYKTFKTFFPFKR